MSPSTWSGRRLLLRWRARHRDLSAAAPSLVFRVVMLYSSSSADSLTWWSGTGLRIAFARPTQGFRSGRASHHSARLSKKEAGRRMSQLDGSDGGAALDLIARLAVGGGLLSPTHIARLSLSPHPTKLDHGSVFDRLAEVRRPRSSTMSVCEQCGGFILCLCRNPLPNPHHDHVFLTDRIQPSALTRE